jgi:hypothetical protein
MNVNTAAYRVVQIAIGEQPNKSPVKSIAGMPGAHARAKTFTKRKRLQIDRKANRARWSRKHKETTL